eukprot:8722178-Pyramimonas_sp.AAC.1
MMSGFVAHLARADRFVARPSADGRRGRMPPKQRRRLRIQIAFNSSGCRAPPCATCAPDFAHLRAGDPLL